MASRLLLRRSVVATRAASSAMRGASPPLPPFARLPAPSQPVRTQTNIVSCCCCTREFGIYSFSSFAFSLSYLFLRDSWLKITISSLTMVSLLNLRSISIVNTSAAEKLLEVCWACSVFLHCFINGSSRQILPSKILPSTAPSTWSSRDQRLARRFSRRFRITLH